MASKPPTRRPYGGADGIGPWQNREMRGCLREFVERGVPVIPVRQCPQPFFREAAMAGLAREDSPAAWE